jgi:hypothetical protein
VPLTRTFGFDRGLVALIVLLSRTFGFIRTFDRDWLLVATAGRSDSLSDRPVIFHPEETFPSDGR